MNLNSVFFDEGDPLEVQTDRSVHLRSPGDGQNVHPIVRIESQIEATGQKSLGNSESADQNADERQQVLRSISNGFVVNAY